LAKQHHHSSDYDTTSSLPPSENTAPGSNINNNCKNTLEPSLKHILTILTYQRLIEMSDNDKELESAQKDQKKIGKAESNPDTSGPTENLREEAAEMTDESQDSEEPA
jgi:hypothetical protein